MGLYRHHSVLGDALRHFVEGQNFEKRDFIKILFSIYESLSKYREFYGGFEYPLGFP